MPKRIFDKEAPYQSIRGAAYITGLSQGFIRAGCRANRIPHIKCGREYRIFMPALFEQLKAASVGILVEGDKPWTK